MRLKYLLSGGVAYAFMCSPAFLGGAEPEKSPKDTRAPNAPQNFEVVESIIAKINGEIITQTELNKQRSQILAEARKDPGLTGEKLDEFVKTKQSDSLRDQIDNLLLVQRAKDLSISVDSEVTRRIADLQAQSKKSDPEEFHKWVAEGSGVSFEDFRNGMKNQMLTQRVISQEVARNINVPQGELKAYYEAHKAEFVREEQVFLREILIAPKDDSPEAVAAAEKKAKDISARARKGERFTDLAKSYSDAASAAQDGDLGPQKRENLRKEMADVVFKQNRGYVTDPIRTGTGWVILKIEERHDAGQAPFEDVQNEIMEKLYMPKMQPEIRKYLTKLREEAFVEIRGGYVDSGAAAGKDTSWKDPATLKPQTTTKEEVTAARKKKRVFGIIPRRSSGVSSSNPAAPAKPAADTAPAKSGSSSSSSSSSDQ